MPEILEGEALDATTRRYQPPFDEFQLEEGFRIHRLWILILGCWVWTWKLRLRALGSGLWGLGSNIVFRVQGFGFWVSGS